MHRGRDCLHFFAFFRAFILLSRASCLALYRDCIETIQLDSQNHPKSVFAHVRVGRCAT